MQQHSFKKGKSSGCAVKGCGYIRGNEQAHGHTCSGKMLRSPDGRTASCYACGRTITSSDIPVMLYSVNTSNSIGIETEQQQQGRASR